jgi:hypothetical protein
MTETSSLDARWGDDVPFFLRSPEVALAGDWRKFFGLVSHRIERVYLYGETGETNPVYIGDCLVSNSLGRFPFGRQRPFHEAIRLFFSPAQIDEHVQQSLWSDPEVKKATQELEQASTSRGFPGGSALFIDPLPKTQEVISAERNLHEIRIQREPLHRAKILNDRLWVLEVAFKMILESPKGGSLFPKLRAEIRRFCAETKISYDVAEDGAIIRLGPDPLGLIVSNSLFNTGDVTLDDLLEAARQKFRERDPKAHRESLEKLWDAWERLKTLEEGKDKKTKTSALFSKLSVSPEFRKLLLKEAQELTDIGNNFMIRHSETDKIPVGPGAEEDYLFYRLFSLIWLLLNETGRLA